MKYANSEANYAESLDVPDKDRQSILGESRHDVEFLIRTSGIFPCEMIGEIVSWNDMLCSCRGVCSCWDAACHTSGSVDVHCMSMGLRAVDDVSALARRGSASTLCRAAALLGKTMMSAEIETFYAEPLDVTDEDRHMRSALLFQLPIWPRRNVEFLVRTRLRIRVGDPERDPHRRWVRLVITLRLFYHWWIKVTIIGSPKDRQNTGLIYSGMQTKHCFMGGSGGRGQVSLDLYREPIDRERDATHCDMPTPDQVLRCVKYFQDATTSMKAYFEGYLFRWGM